MYFLVGFDTVLCYQELQNFRIAIVKVHANLSVSLLALIYIYIYMIHDTQSAQISQKQDGRNIYIIIKTMCSLGYHHNGFMATHALGHIYIFIYI